jgi:hypothetical protein
LPGIKLPFAFLVGWRKSAAGIRRQTPEVPLGRPKAKALGYLDTEAKANAGTTAKAIQE